MRPQLPSLVVRQILIRLRMLGTRRHFAHTVSESHNHPDGVGLAPFSRALLVGFAATKVYSAIAADIVMESTTLTTARSWAGDEGPRPKESEFVESHPNIAQNATLGWGTRPLPPAPLH